VGVLVLKSERESTGGIFNPKTPRGGRGTGGKCPADLGAFGCPVNESTLLRKSGLGTSPKSSK
jgi:hypothetical protein